MRLAIASDHAAVALRLQLAQRLRAWGHEVLDLGADEGQRVDYPDYAARACAAMTRGDVDRAVLVCGTGIGMSIAANKLPGVRAALVHDVTTAQLAAEHNDANVLCLGGRVLGPVTCEACLEAWLGASFEQRHQPRLDKLHALERLG